MKLTPLGSTSKHVMSCSDSSSIKTSSPTPLKSPEIQLWYARYLEHKAVSAWVSLIQPAIVGIQSTVSARSPAEQAIVYRVLGIVAEGSMQKQKDLSLSDILDKLDSARLLKIQPDGERDIATQLVFSAVGWLSK